MNTHISAREHDTAIGTNDLAVKVGTARPFAAQPASEDLASVQHETEVNPLWMITGGLAAFLLILVAIG